MRDRSTLHGALTLSAGAVALLFVLAVVLRALA